MAGIFGHLLNPIYLSRRWACGSERRGGTEASVCGVVCVLAFVCPMVQLVFGNS